MKLKEFGTSTAGAAVERNAAYAVIIDQQSRVLIARTEAGLFLPGGGLEEGESASEAVIREVGEEAGAVVKLSEHIGTAVQHFVAEGVAYRMVAEFFGASVVRRSAELGEHVVEWSDPEALKGRMYHECHEWAVVVALSGGAI